MLALYIGSRHGALPAWTSHINGFVGIGGIFGSHSAEVLAGVLVGQKFLDDPSPRGRLRFMVWFGLACYAAGTLLRPLHGISKLGGTESWILVCAGECALLLALFYWLMDVRGWTKWALALIPVGVNPLLAYFLPDFFNKVLNLVSLTGLRPWGWFWHSWSGWSGVANCAVMALAMTGLTALATRFRVVLKL
jgi:predicted acyltransferase